MRRIASFAVIGVLALAACGSGTSSNDESGSKSTDDPLDVEISEQDASNLLAEVWADPAYHEYVCEGLHAEFGRNGGDMEAALAEMGLDDEQVWPLTEQYCF